MNMKQPDKRSKKNGYFAALFSFICVIAIFAGVGLFSQKPSEQKKQPNQESAQIENEPVTERVDVNKNATPPLSELTAQNSENPLQTTPAEEVAEAELDVVAKKEPEKPAEPQPEAPEAEASLEESDNLSASADAEETVFVMQAPIDGEIVMDYSIDSAIYDVTLDQYRTNDNICIGANVGTEIKAAADGIVSYVGYNEEEGNMIVIDHDNGWRTTYSQLDSNIPVAKGDSVQVGQVVGSVGTPTKYGVMLGSHLAFQVTRDDQTIDPKIAMGY